jgi:hypothetical protein
MGMVQLFYLFACHGVVTMCDILMTTAVDSKLMCYWRYIHRIWTCKNVLECAADRIFK